MMGVLARVAGPRVLMGVAGASVAAIAVLTWMLFSARDDAATAEAQNSQLRATVTQQEQDQAQLRAELDRRDAAVAEAQRERGKLREQARAARTELEEALNDDPCADRPHPDAVARGLRFGAGGEDQD